MDMSRAIFGPVVSRAAAAYRPKTSPGQQRRASNRMYATCGGASDPPWGNGQRAMAALRYETNGGGRASFTFPRDAGGTQRGAGALESCAARVVRPAGRGSAELGGYAAGTQGVCPSAEFEVWGEFVLSDWCGPNAGSSGGGVGRGSPQLRIPVKQV